MTKPRPRAGVLLSVSPVEPGAWGAAIEGRGRFSNRQTQARA